MSKVKFWHVFFLVTTLSWKMRNQSELALLITGINFFSPGHSPTQLKIVIMLLLENFGLVIVPLRHTSPVMITKLCFIPCIKFRIVQVCKCLTAGILILISTFLMRRRRMLRSTSAFRFGFCM